MSGNHQKLKENDVENSGRTLSYEKNSKSEAKFIMSSKLSCYAQVNSVAKPNFK